MSTEIISGAPALADTPKPDPDLNSLKRKASSSPRAEPDSPKRPKTEAPSDKIQARTPTPTGASPEAKARDAGRKDRGAASIEEARARVAREEKSRGRRLFGGLLGTLNQRGMTAQQQKRLDIEKKQQERLKQQRVAALEAQAGRKSKIEERRKVSEIHWKELVLREQHKALRQRARVLHTKTQPSIQWKPWRYTQAQKELIREQKEEAEEKIKRDLEEFQLKKEAHARKFNLSPPPRREEPQERKVSREEPAEAEKEADETSTVITKDAESAESAAVTTEEPKEARFDAEKEQQDESGDVMMESGEDVVIY